MSDNLGHPTGDIGTGSALLLTDEVPLEAAEARVSDPINTRMISTLGIDISADQACTVKVTRLPDGATPGAVSTVGEVAAGTPAFFMYSAVLCPAVLITVTNSAGVAMTAYSLHVRGGA